MERATLKNSIHKLNAMEMGKFMIVVPDNCVDILRRIFVWH